MTVPGVDTTTWQYNGRGGVLQETRAIAGAGSFTTAYTYDQVDRVRTLTYPSGEVITTTYNARGLPATLTGAETYVAGATYDAAGRLTQLQLQGGALQTSYSYYPWPDAPNGGRLQAIRSGPPATPNALQDLAYTYDLAGNVATITDAGAATAYGYDALARLTTVAGQVRYSYDPTGNLLRKVEPDLGWDLTLTYTDTAPIHAPREVNDPALGFGYELGYDANGSLIQARSNGVNQNTDTFTWDAENRLARRETQALVLQWYACPVLSDDPNPCVPGWRATWQTTGWDAYTRDADGAVLRRTDATGQHLYIGGHYELHAGAATSYYHFGGRRVAMRTGTEISYLLADHLGSTRVVEAGNGASAQHYTPWGEIVEGWNNTLPTEYTYTGQREASATGGIRLLDYGARSYWPFAGRFISPDSIVPEPGDPQSLNRYAYALNNPLRYTDPTGMFTEDEIMQYLDVDTWEEVLGMFEEGGQFAGRWGVLQLLRQAHLGDAVGIYQDVKAGEGDSGFGYFLDLKKLAEGILRERDGRLTLEGRGLWDVASLGKLGDVYFHNACFTCGGPMSAYEKRNSPRVQRDIDWVGVGFDIGGVAADAVSFGAAGRVVNAAQVAKSAKKVGQALNVTSTAYDLGSGAVELHQEGRISGPTGRSLLYSGAGFVPGLGTISDAVSAFDGIFYWGP